MQCNASLHLAQETKGDQVTEHEKEDAAIDAACAAYAYDWSRCQSGMPDSVCMDSAMRAAIAAYKSAMQAQEGEG
jgi:hypothetical protein